MLKTGIRKIDHFKLYYWHDATLIGKFKLPQLKPTQFVPPYDKVVGFNERNGIKNPSEYWIDYFIDDILFESFWNHPEVSFSNMRKFAGVITTDYSMYPEMLPGQLIWNCTRNRIMAYYLQQQGFDVIPTASWCQKEDFEWCFDGLPEEASIAVSSNGCMSDPYGKRIFLEGVEELQKKKNPTHLIVCGREIKDLDNYDNVSYYRCFSQRWKERVKLG